MSTRAIYTFKGFGETHHVYKHHDGYLSGAAQWLEAALELAWELPRYEPHQALVRSAPNFLRNRTAV